MSEKLLKRNEVEEKYTWDLTALFQTEEEYESTLVEIQKETSEIEARFRGKLNTPEAINQCLDRLRLLYEKIIRVGTYSSLAISVDQTDEANQMRAAKLGNIMSIISSQLSFIESEIIQQDEKIINGAIGASSENKGYLEDIRRKKEHALNPETEKALAALSSVLNAPYLIYERAKLADMAFPVFKVDGKEYPLSFMLFEEVWEFETDREVRHAAFAAFSSKLREYQHTIAAAYQTQVQQEKVMATLRGFDSVFDYLLFEQKVDREFYDRQIDLIVEHLAPHMRRYAGLLQKLYGLEEMTFADLKLPVDTEHEADLSIEEGREYIVGGLSILGDDYREMLERAYEERWMDFVQNVGKSTGAFCSSPYGSHPYILMSWTGKMGDLFTLAHELGHAGHFYLAHQEQNIFDSRPSMYFIEAPSTMNELLLVNYLLEKTDNPGMKRWVLSSIVGRTYYHNFVTHLLEAHFQREVYRIVDEGGSLSAPLLHQLKRETLEKFWGDAVQLQEGAELTWMRQPHYYMGLYPYTYSAGLTIATEVSRRILDEGNKAVEDWRQVLKAGGTKSPQELARMAGVDVSTEQPLMNTIEYIGQLIDEIIRLSDVE